MARFNLRPRPKPSKALFPFLALPAELRLQIYSYLLLSVPSYRYSHADLPSDLPGPRPHQRRRRSPLRRHGMLLANHQLHAEYVQAFYERTSFSFCVYTDNGTQISTVLFPTLPPALLSNLRQCRLYVDLGMVAWGLDLLIKAYVAQVEALLGRMERVRWVHLVWGLLITMGQWKLQKGPWRELLRKEEEELWEQLGGRFVRRLKGNAGMRGITIKVANRILKLEKKGVEWVER